MFPEAHVDIHRTTQCYIPELKIIHIRHFENLAPNTPDRTLNATFTCVIFRDNKQTNSVALSPRANYTD
jgi:hypothetical protein